MNGRCVTGPRTPGYAPDRGCSEAKAWSDSRELRDLAGHAVENNAYASRSDLQHPQGLLRHAAPQPAAHDTRAARPLRALDADIVFLQEVHGKHERHARATRTGRPRRSTSFSPTRSGATSPTAGTRSTTPAITATRSCRAFRSCAGTTRTFPPIASRSAGCCIARSASRAGSEPLHCVCVHLGLRSRERSRQLEKLRQRIERLVPPQAPLIVAGDFNDWRLPRDAGAGASAQPARGIRAGEGPARAHLSGGAAADVARPHLRARLPGAHRARPSRPRVGAHLRPRGAHRDRWCRCDRNSSTATASRCSRAARSISPR